MSGREIVVLNQLFKVLYVEDDFVDVMFVQYVVCEVGDFDIVFEVVGMLKDVKCKLVKEVFDLVLFDFCLFDFVYLIDMLEMICDCIGEIFLFVFFGFMVVDKIYLFEDVVGLDKNESF